MTQDAELTRRAAILAESAGLGSVQELGQLAGGANNRVFLLKAANGIALLKAYFRHLDDRRDRLGAEFAFSKFAWDHGLRALPQPLACDAEAGLGLFEYVDGRPLRPDEVDAGAVDQAIAFFVGLNQHREAPDAVKLPEASEVCFRLQDHLYLVGKRVERLVEMEGTIEIDRAALEFIESRLVPAWAAVADGVSEQARVEHLSMSEVLPPYDRCLSPSDFGYHNAILAADGRLRFVDFEYAGWDDPARMVCDFFCQPALPVAMNYFDRFARAVTNNLWRPERHLARTRLLLPVYRIKWCCIVLNDFLPTAGRRRLFAVPAQEMEQRKIRQLDKARRLLDAYFPTERESRQAA